MKIPPSIPSRELGEAMLLGMDQEERLWQQLVSKVQEIGDPTQIYLVLVQKFCMYCRYHSRDKAVETLAHMDLLAQGDALSSFVAERTHHCLNDLSLCEEYLQRGYEYLSSNPDALVQQSQTLTLKSLELELLARINPNSPQTQEIFADVHRLSFRPIVFSEALLSAMRILTTTGAVDERARDILQEAWSDPIRRQKFNAEDRSQHLQAIEDLLAQLPDENTETEV